MVKEIGMITGVIAGVVFLVILLIIGFVVIQNLAIVEDSLAGLTTVTVTNESGALNSTPFNLSVYQIAGFANPIIIQITNTTGGWDINVANATVTTTGQVRNATIAGSGNWFEDVFFTYTYQFQETTVTTNELRSNFTTGIKNVSNKLPTIFLIMAVVLILGILVFLWANFKKMQVVGGGQASGQL